MNMKKACEQYCEGIADLASGLSNAGAEIHVAECADCFALLGHLRQTIEVLGVAEFHAPIDVVRRAQGLMPSRQPILARLAASTLQAAGVRAAQSAEAFQLRFESGDLSIRMMYDREPDGWTILGRLSEVGWEVLGPLEPIEVAKDGSFQFKVSDLADSAIDLLRGETIIHIPSPLEDGNAAASDH